VDDCDIAVNQGDVDMDVTQWCVASPRPSSADSRGPAQGPADDFQRDAIVVRNGEDIRQALTTF
jgi:hypothetical protein